MLALKTGLEHLLDNPRDCDTPIVICTDSMASMATLGEGPTAQTSPLGTAVWRALSRLSRHDNRQIHAQWVPSHCGINGNERADSVALPRSAPRVQWALVARSMLQAARSGAVWLPDR